MKFVPFRAVNASFLTYSLNTCIDRCVTFLCCSTGCGEEAGETRFRSRGVPHARARRPQALPAWKPAPVRGGLECWICRTRWWGNRGENSCFCIFWVVIRWYDGFARHHRRYFIAFLRKLGSVSCRLCKLLACSQFAISSGAYEWVATLSYPLILNGLSRDVVLCLPSPA